MKKVLVRKNSQITFEDNKVTKTFFSDLACEYEKANALWEISQKNNFLCPRPLKLNKNSNCIEFEYIETEASVRVDYLSFMKSKKQNGSILEIFSECGRVLGCIHKDLVLHSKRVWKPSVEFKKATKNTSLALGNVVNEAFPCSYLHCDYGFENVERVKPGLSVGLAVFDPSPNNFTTSHANTFGPIYIDIGNFLSAIDGLVPIKNYPFMKWGRLELVKDAFLEGYKFSSGVNVDKEIAKCFSYAISSCYLTYKFQNKVLKKLAMSILYNGFKRNKVSSNRN